jgi:phosphate ABC transporter membrane protein 1, PhoT family (TC 3.A.1.7.1)
VGARPAADGHEPHLHPDYPSHWPQGGEGSWL